MIRVQIQFTEEQVRLLKRRAADLDVSLAQVVRDAVDRLVADADTDAVWQRALSVIGMIEPTPGEPTDVSENHDQYLDDVWGA